MTERPWCCGCWASAPRGRLGGATETRGGARPVEGTATSEAVSTAWFCRTKRGRFAANANPPRATRRQHLRQLETRHHHHVHTHQKTGAVEILKRHAPLNARLRVYISPPFLSPLARNLVFARVAVFANMFMVGKPPISFPFFESSTRADSVWIV